MHKNSSEHRAYVKETLEAINAWTIVLKNELRLMEILARSISLWNMLVRIGYHRPFYVMGLRYNGTVGAPPLREALTLQYTGGPVEEHESFEFVEAPSIEMRTMASSEDGIWPLLTTPLDNEVLELRAQLEDLDKVRTSLVDCSPPYGKEYRLALRRAAAQGIGRYNLRGTITKPQAFDLQDARKSPAAF